MKRIRMCILTDEPQNGETFKTLFIMKTLEQQAEELALNTWIGTAEELVRIEDVKKGDFFRLPKGKETYQKDSYCRINKKYVGQAWSDISKWTLKKKGTLVLIGFEF